MINKPPPLNWDYNRDPNIWALKGGGFINHGSTLRVYALGFMVEDLGFMVKGLWPRVWD